MMKKLLFILAALAGGSLCADETLPADPDWRDALGSPDFQKRYEASMAIWNAGDESLPFLTKLIDGDDPELAARATELKLKIQAGVTPETPAEIVAQIELLFAANTTTLRKIAILEELRRLEQYDFIIRLRLRGLLSEDRVEDKADEIIQAALPELIRARTDEGRIDEVKYLLTLLSDFPSMIFYANLVDQEGGLDEEIARLRELEGAENEARYLACLRVKGDAGLLLFEAERLGDQQAAALASLAMGDYLPYFEYLHEHQDDDLTSRKYLEWTLAKARGKHQEAKEIKDSLLHLCKGGSEVASARMNLFRMGYRDEVVASYQKSEWRGKFNYWEGQEDFPKALLALGLSEGQVTDEWLDRTAQALRSEFVEERSGDSADKFFSTAAFFEARGEIEAAVKCYESLFKVVKEEKRSSFSRWLAFAFNSSPEAIIRILGKEAQDPDFDLPEVLESIFGSEGDFQWLYDTLTNLYPEDSVEKRLLLGTSIFGLKPGGYGTRIYVSEEEFEEAQEGVLQTVLKSEEKEDGLRKLLRFAMERNWQKDIEKFQALLEKEGDGESEFFKGSFAASLMNYEAAGKHMADFEIDEKESLIQVIYEKGTAMKKAGLPGGEDFRKKARLYSRGTATDLIIFEEVESRYLNKDEAYELIQKALLRLDLGVEDSSRFNTEFYIMSKLAAGAMAQKQWGKAVAFQEAAAWESGNRTALVAALARHKILLVQGALAKQKGDLVAAVDFLTEAHSLIPRSGSLADDFFPLVRELGLVELHDQLFAKSARLSREIIEAYPKDHNAYNNFAWIASRSNRQLDEAEGYLKKALEMMPRSAAYLDTMGEIYFARRNREEAIRWSNLSLDYRINDVQLIEQNQRFVHGDFPPR